MIKGADRQVNSNGTHSGCRGCKHITGATITSGRGRTIIQAMAEAALAGKRMILENGRGMLPI
jgi:hypothetical protein